MAAQKCCADQRKQNAQMAKYAESVKRAERLLEIVNITFPNVINTPATTTLSFFGIGLKQQLERNKKDISAAYKETCLPYLSTAVFVNVNRRCDEIRSVTVSLGRELSVLFSQSPSSADRRIYNEISEILKASGLNIEPRKPLPKATCQKSLLMTPAPGSK